MYDKLVNFFNEYMDGCIVLMMLFINFVMVKFDFCINCYFEVDVVKKIFLCNIINCINYGFIC